MKNNNEKIIEDVIETIFDGNNTKFVTKGSIRFLLNDVLQKQEKEIVNDLNNIYDKNSLTDFLIKFEEYLKSFK